MPGREKTFLPDLDSCKLSTILTAWVTQPAHAEPHDGGGIADAFAERVAGRSALEEFFRRFAMNLGQTR
jgi:hypothetical protein